MTGWYKQQRSLPEREWFKEPTLVQLYVALKSLAYVADGRFEGTIIRRGSCPTTRADLCEITGMKRMTLDRCMKKLIAYGEIIVKANNRFSVITICDYDSCGGIETLFSATDDTTNGIANGTTVETTDGTTHLLTIEGRYKDNLRSLNNPSKMEREARDVALEAKKRYNKTFDGKLPPCIRLTMPTRMMVEECIKRYGMQSIDMVFEQVLAEPFSLGNNKTGFIASFQYIFSPKNYQQYLERWQLAKKKGQGQEKKSVGVIETPPEDSRSIADKLEQRKQTLMQMVELVKANPKSSARAPLVSAYNSGELQRFGIYWTPDNEE
ncbi:hypothetical protein L6472_06005 [Prevotella sp. E13-17]|uniref:hypothetical protein n=1 Tax=Prevotella sp. E13-17 TaxID=2913616 RepID=UPI001EDBC312|nr:hypothetical protein [Prevotella sp. E13-17]UKK52131.1 hypothetical protein L6472_06005 [Prevotella sp. E13-17]